MANNSRNYRGWTAHEDAKLVEALINMINTKGFKSENGFRSGYLQHLELALKESLPSSGLLGKPHIESRIKTMKRDWQGVYDMLQSCSGFGYDKERNCVIAEAPVWSSYLENHKPAAKWKHKIFPHYEELCVIFGKDRAQGNKAKSVVEMEEEVNMEEEEQMDNENDSFSHNEGTDPSLQAEETSRGQGKKRKRTSQLTVAFQKLNDAVVLFGDRLKETSAELSEGIKYELEKEKKTTMITSEITKMTSLSELEMFRAIEKIKSDPNRVTTFWDLGEERREARVRFLLSM